jgi:hypothetical protein
MIHRGEVGKVLRGAMEFSEHILQGGKALKGRPRVAAPSSPGPRSNRSGSACG